ncbi:hypothetical protein [Deinococcus sp. UYEF24]
MTIELLVIDSTVIANSTPAQLRELEDVCGFLSQEGVQFALVSTNNQGMRSATNKGAQISFSASLSGEEVLGGPYNKFKGGAVRIESVCNALGIAAHTTLYLGDDRSDYTSALHAGALFIQARWVRHDQAVDCVYATRPSYVWRYASHYLIHPPRWTYFLDAPQYRFSLRALLSANTLNDTIYLPGNSPINRYTLIDLLKDQNGAQCGQSSSAAILFLHAMTSAKLEGLIPPYSTITVYPSSQPAQTNPIINEMSQLASRQFMGQFHHDLIVRAVPAAKSRANKLNGTDSYLTQTNSVHLNPSKSGAIEDKTVVVFDDFHTTGKSLDWARSLLTAAGARRVVAIALGKFGGSSKPHGLYLPTSPSIITPYTYKTYTDADFSTLNLLLTQSTAGRPIIEQSFRELLHNRPYK